MFEVIVGNIGTVYTGHDEVQARKEYDDYIEISKADKGHRAYQEPVTLLHDGDILRDRILDEYNDNDNDAIAPSLVTLDGMPIENSKVKAWLESQDGSSAESHYTVLGNVTTGDRRYSLVVGESSFEIDCYGIVRDTGRYYGNHWIACWLWDLSMDSSYPDDIVYGEGDRQYSVFALEPWQSDALSPDIQAIAVYSDDNGFVGYVYQEGKSAEELAEAIAATYEGDSDEDEDDCDSDYDS